MYVRAVAAAEYKIQDGGRVSLSNFKSTYNIARQVKDSFKVSVPKSSLKSAAFKTANFNVRRFRNAIDPPGGVSSTARAMRKMYMSDTARALIKIENSNNQNIQAANKVASLYFNAPARESTAIDHLVNDDTFASHHAPNDSSKELIALVQSSLETQSQIAKVLERLHNQQEQANQIAIESAQRAESWHSEDSLFSKKSLRIGIATLIATIVGIFIGAFIKDVVLFLIN